MKYSLKITKKQAQVICEALEIYARLGTGRLHTALDVLPVDDKASFEWYSVKILISQLIQQHTKHGVDGWKSSLSIESDDVKDESKVAWDLQQEIRRRLSEGYYTAVKELGP